jgi:hypothetical protein
MLSNTLIKCKHCNSTNCHISTINIEETEGLQTTIKSNTITIMERMDEDASLPNIIIWIHCHNCSKYSILTLKNNANNANLEYITASEYARRNKLK